MEATHVTSYRSTMRMHQCYESQAEMLVEHSGNMAEICLKQSRGLSATGLYLDEGEHVSSEEFVVVLGAGPGFPHTHCPTRLHSGKYIHQHSTVTLWHQCTHANMLTHQYSRTTNNDINTHNMNILFSVHTF